FFQAEDGIRDRNVTGVQTCALPISRALRLVRSGQVQPVGAPPRTPAGSTAATVKQLKALAIVLAHPIYWVGTNPATTYELTRTRSEERRVGKECRAEGGAEQ